MARPERKNADYFPFYAKDGRTLFLLESKYKCKGTGFFTNVMRFLTLETDHHVNILDETDRLYFFSKCHCDEESGMDMLSIMSKTGKIDRELWEKHIVASQALLDSLADAYRNRKNDIISMDEIREIYVSDVTNKVKCAGNEVNDASNTQTKLKKTKVKKTKVKKSNSKEKKPIYASLSIPYPPESIDEVIKFFIENGYTKESAINAFKYYEDQVPPWHDTNQKPVLSWKSKMRVVWFKPENKISNQNPGSEFI